MAPSSDKAPLASSALRKKRALALLAPAPSTMGDNGKYVTRDLVLQQLQLLLSSKYIIKETFEKLYVYIAPRSAEERYNFLVQQLLRPKAHGKFLDEQTHALVRSLLNTVTTQCMEPNLLVNACQHYFTKLVKSDKSDVTTQLGLLIDELATVWIDDVAMNANACIDMLGTVLKLIRENTTSSSTYDIATNSKSYVMSIHLAQRIGEALPEIGSDDLLYIEKQLPTVDFYTAKLVMAMLKDNVKTDVLGVNTTEKNGQITPTFSSDYCKKLFSVNGISLSEYVTFCFLTDAFRLHSLGEFLPGKKAFGKYGFSKYVEEFSPIFKHKPLGQVFMAWVVFESDSNPVLDSAFRFEFTDQKLSIAELVEHYAPEIMDNVNAVRDLVQGFREYYRAFYGKNEQVLVALPDLTL